MYKAINHPACCNWKAEAGIPNPTHIPVRSLYLSSVCHMGPWLYAGMVFSLTLGLRPGTRSRCRFFATLRGQLLGHFSQSMNLLQGQNLLPCWLQDGILCSLKTGQPSSIFSIVIYWRPWQPGSGWLWGRQEQFHQEQMLKETVTCNN